MWYLKSLDLILICVLCCAITSGTDTNSTKSSNKEGRIVGGANAGVGQFPYQVSLRTAKGGSHFCGGSIYSNRWIVTAAHCIYGRSALSIQIAVGTISVKGGTIYSASKLKYHENYNRESLMNDIGLIQTATTIVFNSNVQPIPLGSSVVTGGTAVASGWGRTSSIGPIPSTLQYVILNVITNNNCKSRYLNTGISRYIYENVICTVMPVGKGACNGDSGGPLAQNGVLIGTVSWGLPCARGFPDAFARVSSHKTWIVTNAQ